MKSKIKIERQLKKKQNPELVKTIISAKKNPNWLRVAEVLTNSKRKTKSFNLSEINKFLEKNKEKVNSVIVPGKVLSQGAFNQKVKIAALNFSETTKEKLKNYKIEFSNIIDEIKKNPDGKGIYILEK